MGRPQPLLNFYLLVHLHLAISGKFLCWRYFTEIVKTFLANGPCWYGAVPALAQMQDISILQIIHMAWISLSTAVAKKCKTAFFGGDTSIDKSLEATLSGRLSKATFTTGRSTNLSTSQTP